MRSLVQPPPAAPTAAPATAAETMTPCSQLSLQTGKVLPQDANEAFEKDQAGQEVGDKTGDENVKRVSRRLPALA